jgi:hypothetical protein
MPTVLSEDALVIPARFNGPPRSANGGIACGAVARFVDGPAEVALARRRRSTRRSTWTATSTAR